ncbi:cysteine protease [Elysia marginata]|uniref:Cysteine protease n=1 Tax=Elysia marginata TaxID=1093978 RepID=A0AAV4G3H7_9GAST|nr:cysteine protease [Elysia marginata]
MEASAKQSHRVSTNRLSFEDSHSSPRCMSNSRQEDVLSLSSWSDFEHLDVSDLSLSFRDQNQSIGTELASVRRLSKEHKSKKSPDFEYDSQNSGSNLSREESISTRLYSKTTQHSNHRPRPTSSVPVRSRSSSNVERGPFGRSFGTNACASMSPTENGSDFNFEYDVDRPTIDQPPNPFQDFSFLGIIGNESSNTFTQRDYTKMAHKSNIKPGSQKLYPVLDNLKHISNGSNAPLSQRSQRADLDRDGYASLEEMSEGPVSMPVVSNSLNCEDNAPFSSLPVSVPSQNQPLSPSQGSQIRHRNDRDLESKGTWSIWKLYQSQPILSKAPTLKRQPKSSSDLEALRESFEHRLEHDNMKTKVMSAWNNLKYGWMFNTKSTMKYDSPLFMLGKCYHMRKQDNDTRPADEFLKDFTSRIWMTYRSNFYPIPGTKLNTDCGWGCMLRSAQMLITQCLVMHYLGRDWRLHNPQTETEQTYYREIIRWFSDPVDAPSDKSPFSLHHLVSFGRHYNKEPGEWFGPSSAAYIFRDAFARASQTFPILSQLCVYVAQDCTVYMDDVVKLCTAREKSESLSNSTEAENLHRDAGQEETWLRSLIILIPMRLGGEAMNEIYVPCIKNLLTQENCMGIIGGKPKHSLYFIGWQDNKLIHLDPHFCREAVDTSDKNFRIESYHCMTPKKLTITRMDPSCTVGFYIRNAAEFKKFVAEVREVRH